MHFKDAAYDGQLVRSLSATIAHAADLGEVMETARRIGEPTAMSWHDAWLETATRAKASAERAVGRGDRVGARNAYLRASEYFRQTSYFVRSDLDDAQLRSAYDAHVNSFRAAIALMDHPAEAVRIPYETTTLNAYLFSPDSSGVERPTIIFPCGYDSTAEAGWVNVPAALDRGYNVLVFEGPGQGESLIVQRLFFRPDFEKVMTPVIDWLLTRDEVDPTSLVLIGRSFAGYLAPRAAAFEHRIAALVCDPAQPAMTARIPQGVVGKVAPVVVRAQMRFSADRSEFFGARMAAHGITSISKYFAELRRFTMIDDAPSISCPTLIIEAENDFAGGSGQSLRDALTCPSELIALTAAQGADGHCAGLGQEVWAETVYGWLEATLRPPAP